LCVVTINYKKYKKDWENCPKIIYDLNYNIDTIIVTNNDIDNMEYLCSYEYQEKHNDITCTALNILILFNENTTIFFSKEKNIIFETKIGNGNSKNRQCIEGKKHYMLAFVILPYFRIIFMLCNPIFTAFVPPPPRMNLRRFRRFNFILNQRIEHIESTNVSENQNYDNDFIKQKTKNIIVENKEEFEINVDIKNIQEKCEDKTIDLNEISMDIQSETKMKKQEPG
jgi:hypothetical protein